MSEIPRWEIDEFHIGGGDSVLMVKPRNQGGGRGVTLPEGPAYVVLFTDHEAAIEQVLADAKARIGRLAAPNGSYGEAEWGFLRGVTAALAALTQPQTEIHINSESEPSDEDKAIVGDLVNRAVDRMKSDGGGAATEKCPEDCDGFGQLIGDSDGPCPACSGLESDGGGAATAAGVADADLEGEGVYEAVYACLDACGGTMGSTVLHFLADLDERGFRVVRADTEPGPYAKAFREKFPVPEFPGIKNRQEDQA